MATAIGPGISANELVLSVDMGNPRSFRGMYNTANLSTWNYGTGSVTNWNINGESAANQRISNTNPIGVNSIIWDTPSNDAGSDADGGFNSGYWAIDSAYYYRFSCWIKRTVLGNGSYYLGLYGLNDGNANMGVLTRSGAANSTNPYFFATSWTLNANQWYLYVGHVHPAGSGTGSNHLDTGIYDTSGNKNSGGSDFVWLEGNTKSMIRSYLYYSTDTSTAQCWWQPRIDKMDGTEPSIAELVNGVGGRLIDLSSSGATVAMANGAENFYMTGDIPAMNFNGSNSYTIISDLYDFAGTNQFAVSVWAKSNQATWNDTGYLFSRRNQFIIHPSASTTSVSFYVYVGSWTSVSGSPSDITKWNHYVMTYNAGALKAYINGVLASEASVGSTLSSSTSPTHLGWDDAGTAGRFFDGSISMAQAWKRSLSASEVSQLFNATRSRHGV
jgi:hypothetical protein